MLLILMLISWKIKPVFGKEFLFISRIVERNGKEHKVKIVCTLLVCDCNNALFSGVPCRHMIASFVKSKLEIKNLPFNSRWESAYFQDNLPKEINLMIFDDHDEVIINTF